MGLLELFNSYDKKKRRSHFKNLYFVARADGDVDRAEMDLIVGLAEKFNMTTKEVTTIIRNPDDVNLLIPKTPEERMEHLYDLVTVMIGERELQNHQRQSTKANSPRERNKHSRREQAFEELRELCRTMVELALAR